MESRTSIIITQELSRVLGKFSDWEESSMGVAKFGVGPRPLLPQK